MDEPEQKIIDVFGQRLHRDRPGTGLHAPQPKAMKAAS
jgi:hypothetical protein